MNDLKQCYVLVCPECSGGWLPRFRANLTDDEREKYPCYLCKRKRAAVCVVPVVVNGAGEIVNPKVQVKQERKDAAP